jgi:hypothetical protein
LAVLGLIAAASRPIRSMVHSAFHSFDEQRAEHRRAVERGHLSGVADFKSESVADFTRNQQTS